VIFHEAPSPELAFGVLLTILGLLMMKQRTRAEPRAAVAEAASRQAEQLAEGWGQNDERQVSG